MDSPLWTPSPERVAAADVTAFRGWLAAERGIVFDDVAALWRWSVDDIEAFWAALWRYGGVIASRGWNDVLVDGDRMPGARWFTGARLNYAENLLRRRDDAPAMIFRGENGARRELSHAALYARVAQTAAALGADGVAAGDRVAGFMPNAPETAIAMLATASLGAIWSSCSPDFGIRGVMDRLRPDHAEGAVLRRRLFLQRQDDRQPRAHRRHPGGCAVDHARRRRALRERRCRPRGPARRRFLGRLSRRPAGRRHRLRPAAVRPPAVHHVLVGHNGHAQMHRPRRRRHAVEAPGGTSAAHRSQGGRPAVLLPRPAAG